MLTVIVKGLLAFLPALAANPLAVEFGGGTPIDGGKEWKGKRILGDGKTWRGLFGGGVSGGILGIIIYFLTSPFIDLYPGNYDMLITVFTLSFGAMLGDILASFLKRRIGRERGEKAPLLDQYDFFLGALLLSLILIPDWLLDTYYHQGGLFALMLLLIAVPLLHRVVNIIGYRLGKKDEPW